jgi:phospholipase C
MSNTALRSLAVVLLLLIGLQAQSRGATTTTTLASSLNPSHVGQLVTLTASVTSISGKIPDGELVTFYDGSMVLGAVPLASGKAAYATSSLNARSHYIKASYTGDATFGPSARTVTQVVTKYSTTTVLIASPNPCGHGQPVTFTATVTSTGPNPTGKVWFHDGTTGIGYVTLNGGVATLTKSNLAVGTHPITAAYLGDASAAKSTSSVLLASCVGSTPHFEHVVFVIQENRTPDNLFGSNPNFEPGVDLATSGLNSQNQVIPLTPWPLAGGYDLGHGHKNFLTNYNGGKMNGWASGAFRYVDNSTGAVQPYFDIARQYGWANRMFQTNQGPSMPAHLFLISGTAAPSTFSDLFISGNAQGGLPLGCPGPSTENVSTIDPNGVSGSMFPCFDGPTLVDNLEAAGYSWIYYGSDPVWIAPVYIKNLCVAGTNRFGQPVCTGPARSHGRSSQQFLVDVRNCNLANVTWITPTGGSSDHASGNTGGGPSWVASVVNAIGSSTCGYWQDTAILITWDDWGGWYDHVPPPQFGQSNGWGKSYIYGFRVPLLVVSAYTPAGLVDNKVHDFGSMLRFAEENFKLGLIGPGTWADSYADNLAEFFTLSSPRNFATIPATLPAEYFINSTDKSAPDDD